MHERNVEGLFFVTHQKIQGYKNARKKCRRFIFESVTSKKREDKKRLEKEGGRQGPIV